jgi:hypothetical protein
MTLKISLIENPLFADAVKQWTLVEDAVAGQAAVKKKKEVYLPCPNPEDTDDRGANIRYEQYILRAVYYNVCYRTLSGIVGIVFRKDPNIDLPTPVEYLLDNADGGGTTLMQQSQWVMGEVVKKGRTGMLVDYPAVEGQTSKADVANGIRATIKTYAASTITDWNEEETPTGTRLNFVKLTESRSILDVTTGEREEVVTYIVLRLIDNIYTVQRYNHEGDADGDELTPMLADGKPLSFIPFAFVGSENNNPDIDQALLYDLAVLNIAHYRNSADSEEASFITGQPTLGVTSSLSPTEWHEGNPNGVVIGSRKGHFLGETGSLTLVQADPNILPREAMKDKEKQFVALGAQIVTENNANETAYAVGAKLSTNTSALGLAAGNVSSAYEKCLDWCEMFMDTAAKGEATFSLNTDFFPSQMDAQTITAWVTGIQSKVLPSSILYDMLRDSNLTALTDDEIAGEIEESGTDLDLSTPPGAGAE